VHAVHLPLRGRAALARDAVIEHLGQDQARVVVALLPAMLEFAGPLQQRADRRRRVGLEEGEVQ